MAPVLREQVCKLVEAHGEAAAARMLTITVNCLARVVGGLSIRRGTEALVKLRLEALAADARRLADVEREGGQR